MPSINLLTKPASSACNMRCRYCFYHAIAEARETAFEGMLSDEMLENLIRSGLEYADTLCSFAFQGGEPTLAGLPFYQKAVALQRKYARDGVRVSNALQTNGLLIDEAWAQFLHDEHFLVGLSLDGPADIHNRNRVTADGKGTWNRVMHAARLFDRYQVEYNILCVVTGANAKAIEKIYHFYRKQGFRYLQFIPCLEPLGQARGSEPYHLSVKEYGEFLIRIFDLWYADFIRGDYVSIRHLDNWLLLALGDAPEACNMCGKCSIQFVVEGDGGVYPCDFYVYDEWRLGTLGDHPLETLGACDTAKRFLASSHPIPQQCRACRWGALCRNGCRRDRVPQADGDAPLNFYCEAIRAFFSAREAQFMDAARRILQRRTAPR
ncbi:anaerobic sulfatase maturase [Intestinibacillus massiliensis]|uniref:anaerobic sulfatase maturase n=1 Tax=Intestinibacillus massiliensis TaxID=1871029 RepID=UPI000B34F200|nr:anaerobic sulfatase maturase [Intestinibacillus massiliensis]